jgi:phenylacetate-coenzyme A ligase PaaK-like adenylate-forming protein
MTSPGMNGPDARAIARELLTHTRWSAEQLAAYQRARLKALVRHAVATSPYYREALGPDAPDAGLGELPTLSKATMMERFDDIVTDRRLRLSDLEAHLAGPARAQRFGGYSGDYAVLTTSGSTGMRGIFVYSAEMLASGVASLLRAMAIMGLTPSTRTLGIGAPSAMHVSSYLVAGLAAGRPSGAPQVSAAMPIPQLVETLNAFQPEAFPANAGVAALLAEEQLAGRLRIAPRIVACVSEVLTADMRARIRQAWGIEPHELYATTEACVLASTSPRRAGMHLWEDLSIVEVVDAAGRPVPPGVPGHKVLVTNLVNKVHPLIRYEVSDPVTLAGGDDPGGWPFRRIAAVDGRSDDIIDLPAHGGGTVRVHPAHLRAPFASFPDAVRYQIVHDDNGLSVRVVLRPAAAPGITERLRSALAAQLRRAGAVPPGITVTPVNGIDHEGGTAAKFAVVKSLARRGEGAGQLTRP